MSTPYTTGTVTLTNGSTTILGSGTGWDVEGIVGGVIHPVAAGNALPIADDGVIDDTHITAAVPWAGATGTYEYALVRDSAADRQTFRNTELLAESIARLQNPAVGALAALGGTMAADKISYATGDGTMAWTGLTSYVRGLLAKNNAQNFYAGLGVVPDAQMPEQLRSVCKIVEDWNDASANGWFMGEGAANAPISGWLIGEVKAHNNLYCIQTVTGFTGDIAENSYTYRRMKVGGPWAPWRRIYQTEGDLRGLMDGPTITASGGDVSNITTAMTSRLSVDLTASGSRMMAVATIAAINNHASNGVWVTGRLAAENLTTSSGDFIAREIAMYLPGGNVGQPRPMLPFVLSHGDLVVGQTYRVNLSARVDNDTTPTTPDALKIDVINV